MNKELELRRNKCFDSMKENSVAIFFSGVAKISSEDEFLPFKSNRNFYYLTNIEQENSYLILIKGIGEKKTFLFVDEYDEVKEKWTGKRLTYDEASQISGINNVESSQSFENMTSLVLTDKNNQYGKIDTLYLDFSPEQKIKQSYSVDDFKMFIANEYPHIDIQNSYPILTNLRMIKSQNEVTNIVNAINLTNSGINQLLLNIKPGMKEHELSDYFEYFGKINNVKLAFSTIVASGKNATCLHYPSQKDYINSDDMVLFDLGYSYNGYSGDISRTYPVNGVFSGKGKDIYEAVLATNKEIISFVRSGMTIKQLQEHTKEFLKQQCVEKGLLSPEEDITSVYYHNISHHLGLDTHDISNREKPLEDGNIITVEPGLYFKKYGIGVRIEDDVLISNGVGECLSKNIAKEISDVERLLASKKGIN